MFLRIFMVLISAVLLMSFSPAPPSYKVAVLKYKGGGDYYSNPTSVPNLVEFVNKNLSTNIDKDVPFIEVGNPEIINFPFVHMTGHGNVVFSASDASNLRTPSCSARRADATAMPRVS